jgi:hypothetical protein
MNSLTGYITARGDDPEIGSVEVPQQRYKRIAEAKIAVSAYFESLEKDAASTPESRVAKQGLVDSKEANKVMTA